MQNPDIFSPMYCVSIYNDADGGIMKYLLIVLTIITATSCSALKERTGQFVSESVVTHIADTIDDRLERRGLSLGKIKQIADLNNDGKVDLEEVKRTAKLAAGEALLAKTDSIEKRQREKWKEATKNLVTRDEQLGIKGDVNDFWMWLKATIGMLVAAVCSYLTKQVFSAKRDGRRDTEIAKGHARMDALERLLGKDLNQDGQIGTNGKLVEQDKS
jgi:hypothetical protein